VRQVKKLGYNAAYCPVDADEDNDVVNAYENAAHKADIIIAEVGVWNNPLDPDDKKRKSAFEQCCKQLDLADRIGANCCVNVCGSRGEGAVNLTDETFDMIVEVVRAIVDEVKPKRSYYALETLPKRFPDSIDSYVRLIKAIDRKANAAHLDPVNLINSPRRFYDNSQLIRECFKKLGPYIKSCHAKDITMLPGFPVNLQECQPGLGKLDYATYLTEAGKLSPPPPLMLEHLEEPQEYRDAAKYIRSVAKSTGLSFA
jgi:sugar phosphate isomerase/epimerase